MGSGETFEEHFHNWVREQDEIRAVRMARTRRKIKNWIKYVATVVGLVGVTSLYIFLELK